MTANVESTNLTWVAVGGPHSRSLTKRRDVGGAPMAKRLWSKDKNICMGEGQQQDPRAVAGK